MGGKGSRRKRGHSRPPFRSRAAGGPVGPAPAQPRDSARPPLLGCDCVEGGGMAGREKTEFRSRFASMSALCGSRRCGGGEAVLGEATRREPLRLYTRHIPGPGARLPGPLHSRAAAVSPRSQTPLPLPRYHGSPAGVGQRGRLGQESRAEPSPLAATPADRFRVSGGSVGDALRAMSVRGCVAAEPGGREQRDCPPGWQPKFILAFVKGRYFPFPPPQTPSRFAEK